MSDRIDADDLVLLALEDGNTFLLRMRPGQTHSTHRGTVAHDDLIGLHWGTALTLNTGKEAFLLRPRWIDKMMKVQRRTNIMYPKDVAILLAHLDLRPGARVAEIGCGSGAMTQALAHAVSPGGRVFSYDRRPEFLELAERNCHAAGYCEGIEFHPRQPGDPLEPELDAVFTDIPEPWVEVGVIRDALRGSGRYGAGTPTFNQAERLAEALAGAGFGMIESFEVLTRRILARAGRTRPAHRMVGHTQVLTTAVNVLRQDDASSLRS